MDDAAKALRLIDGSDEVIDDDSADTARER